MVTVITDYRNGHVAVASDVTVGDLIGAASFVPDDRIITSIMNANPVSKLESELDLCQAWLERSPE